MTGNDKKSLTNSPVSPKITPDAFWNIIKRKAKEQGYGVLAIEFTVHGGQITGADLVGTREKIWPY